MEQEENVTVKKKRKKVRKIKRIKRRIARVSFALCLIVAIFFMIYFARYFYLKNKSKKSIREVQEYTPTTVSDDSSDTNLMLKVRELGQENSDIKGWIQIKDTKINFPLLQGEDNEFYLTHDYKKEYNMYGSPFLKNRCDINDVNSNLIVYGHNMRDEEMFNTLTKYQDKDFYEKHKIINVTTENEEREYEIIAAFKSRVFYQRETNVFRYYNELSFGDEEEYNRFISNVKNIQLYDTGVSASYGEQLLTMITCEYSQENGRMVVVAKRVK